MSKINGCGPSGFVGKLVPDSILGVSIHEACNQHDQDYSRGGSEKDRKKSDQRFFKEMRKTISETSKSHVLKPIRLAIAAIYYGFVRLAGKFYFNE